MMTLLQMTLTGGALIATLALLRAVCFDRVSKRVFRGLWLLPVARLLIPWSPAFSLSALSLLSRQQRQLPQDTPVSQAAQAILGGSGGAVAGSAGPSDGQVLAEAGADIKIWLLIWLGGALVLGALFLVSWLVYRRQFASSLPFWWPGQEQWLKAHPLKRHLRIRQSDRVEVPLTYGLLRPVILVPTGMAPGPELDYVLEHEFTHIRRWDGLYKLLLTGVLCLHWCNPLVWLMVGLANRDVELACDEAVIRRFGPEARADYARTLLRFETGRSLATPYASQFGPGAVKQRIAALARRKKISLLVSGLVVLLAAGGVLFWTLSPTPIPPERIEVDGYTYVALRETAERYGYTLRQTIRPYTGTLAVDTEDGAAGTLVQGQSVTCYLSEAYNSPMGAAWFVWQDQHITSCMYDGGMFGATETSYPTPFYLEGRTVYIAEDLVDTLFSSDADSGA